MMNMLIMLNIGKVKAFSVPLINSVDIKSVNGGARVAEEMKRGGNKKNNYLNR